MAVQVRLVPDIVEQESAGVPFGFFLKKFSEISILTLSEAWARVTGVKIISAYVIYAAILLPREKVIGVMLETSGRLALISAPVAV